MNKNWSFLAEYRDLISNGHSTNKVPHILYSIEWNEIDLLIISQKRRYLLGHGKISFLPSTPFRPNFFPTQTKSFAFVINCEKEKLSYKMGSSSRKIFSFGIKFEEVQGEKSKQDDKTREGKNKKLELNIK
jgi:hypothetical protein